MRSVFFVPSISGPSGGVDMLYRTMAALAAMGYETALTCPGGETYGLQEFLRATDGAVRVLPWEGLSLAPSDVYVTPETHPDATAPGITARARTTVYAQHWLFMTNPLVKGLRWKDIPVSYLAVSRPVAWFLTTVLETPPPVLLPPSVHPVFFEAGHAAGVRKNETIRVAFMPRRNATLGEYVRNVALTCLARGGAVPRVEWVAIDNLPLRDVAKTLATCHIFQATAFPEGFGLPPLEAMAAGCAVTGFIGFGGWEYMRQFPFPEIYPESAHPPALCEPPIPLADIHSDGNGLYVPDGDILSAGTALAAMIRMARDGGEPWETLRKNGKETAARYTEERRRETLAALWPKLAG